VLPTRHQICIKKLDTGIPDFFPNPREKLLYISDFGISKTCDDKVFVKAL
jgi:hypothetical protein